MKEAWSDEASCRSIGPEPFFPDLPTRSSSGAIRATCEACPVRQQCLEAALELEQGLPASYRDGWWGGHSPRERAVMDGSTRPPKAPQPSPAAQARQDQRRASVAALTANGLSVLEIAARLECSDQTVYRDLAWISHAA